MKHREPSSPCLCVVSTDGEVPHREPVFLLVRPQQRHVEVTAIGPGRGDLERDRGDEPERAGAVGERADRPIFMQVARGAALLLGDDLRGCTGLTWAPLVKCGVASRLVMPGVCKGPGVRRACVRGAAPPAGRSRQWGGRPVALPSALNKWRGAWPRHQRRGHHHGTVTDSATPGSGHLFRSHSAGQLGVVPLGENVFGCTAAERTCPRPSRRAGAHDADAEPSVGAAFNTPPQRWRAASFQRVPATACRPLRIGSTSPKVGNQIQAILDQGTKRWTPGARAGRSASYPEAARNSRPATASAHRGRKGPGRTTTEHAATA